MQIYPAREAPIPGIDSNKILKKITCKATLLDEKEFNDNLNDNDADVIAVLGAGSIGDYIDKYLKIKSIQ